ncbi:MAG: metal ABC transporter substrate-binding protein [Longimicrobiales bacterium]
MLEISVLAVLLAGSIPAAAQAPAPAADPVRVVASLPVYGSIAKAIGGDQVAVTSIADPREDAHFVRPKPSFAAEIRRADLFITTGLDLELWVPSLLDRAGNKRVSEGGPGYVTTYSGVHLLDIPTAADRAAGDIHIYGNPHIYTDPLNAIIAARNIVIGLKKVSSERSAQWDRGLASFTDQIHRHLFGEKLVEIVGGDQLAQLARGGQLLSFLQTTQFEGSPLTAQLGGWMKAAAVFRGKQIVCYHKNWAYFEDRFQVRCAEFVEAKPGIPPTPGHVARLIDRMRTENIDVLLGATYYDRDKLESVANRGGARLVQVPLAPGVRRGVDDYFSLVDTWVGELAGAFTSR